MPSPAQEVRGETHVPTPADLQRAALQQTQRLAETLGFERWVIVVSFDSLSDGIIARAFPRLDYRAAVIVVDPGYFTNRPRGDLCETIAHELLHIKLTPLRHALLSLSPDTSIARQAMALEESVVSDLSRLAIWACR